LTFWVGSPVFNNLGINLIESSFMQTSSFFQALGKLGFTFVSTVTGMKGGEVTPLMSAGALFGSWFAGAHSTLNFQIGAAIGLVVLFCSRLRIPFTGILMLGEFFDWRVAVLGAPILLLIEASQRMTFDRTDLKSEPKEI
jgi:H+/Cl- antiporter ClcA